MKLSALLAAAGLVLALPVAAQTPKPEEAKTQAPAAPPAQAAAAAAPPPAGQAPAAPAAAAAPVAPPPVLSLPQPAVVETPEAKALRLKEAAEAKRKAEAEKQRLWEERCQIKPVMSDKEIEICREVATKKGPDPEPASKPAPVRKKKKAS